MSTHTLADQLQVARSALFKRHIGGAIARTAGFNVAAAAAAALGGIVIARTVGPTVRGEYAAVTAWFGLLLMVGGVGQPAALCYHVARDPERARGYVATSRAMMLVTGAIALTAGLVVAPVLAHGHPGLAEAYRIAFGGSVLAFIGASYTFSLQATNTARWNLVRVSQPVLALSGILLLRRFHLLTLDTALGVLITTMALQLGYAYYSCRRSQLAPGHARLDLARPLVRYGLAQIAALTPTAVNAYLDQLVLSQLVPPADLGRYAIAVSITLLPVPLVSAIGNVAFPRLAARRAVPAAGRGLPLTAVVVSAVAASAILLPIAAIAFWLIPEVFGPAYRGAVPLLWILTPGGIFLACSGVVGDLLRGLGQPGRVATAQGLAAVFTVILLFALLPSTGVAAAAIASTVSYGVALTAMIRWLLRPPRASNARHKRSAAPSPKVIPGENLQKDDYMRIGIIGPTIRQSFADSFPANIIDALLAMGHAPVALGSTYAVGGRYSTVVAMAIRNALPALDERAQRHIARAALDNECEIVINLEMGLMPSVVRQLRRNGIKVAMWFPDHLVNMGRQLMLLAPYDAIFFKEPHLVDRLRAVLDLPVFYLPQGCNPRWHRPLVAPATEPYLVIAGNMYPSRLLLLERMLASGIPLRLYGAGFPRWVGRTPLRDVHAGRPVVGEEKARVFRSAAAVINTMYPGEIYGVNVRLFEAAGCGAAVLTEFRPTVPDLFAVGDEVLAFHDFDELIDQAKRLLHEGGLSAKVGDAAALRAHESHTYEKRLPVILEKLS